MAENNTTKFNAQDKNGGIGEGKRDSPANPRVMATTSKTAGRTGDLFHEYMKGRNGRRVSACQSYLREKYWKNTVFHAAISGGSGGMRKQGY